MSQIFGIDFGSKNIVISVMKILPDSKVSPITVVEDSINNKKIEVTLSWDGSKLLFGDVASRQKTSKYKYTISCVNDLFGKKLSEVNEEIKEYHKPERIVKGDKEDRVGFDFNGNIITLDEIILLIFHEISEIIRNKVEIKSSEKLKSIFCVPSYWSEKEVNRFKTLCEKSEFECLEIIESYYSSVLCYGYENNNEFDEYSLKYILICDIGYMNNDYTLVGYSKNKFKILNHINGNKNDRYINGQKIDGLLLKEFKRRAENEGYEINDKCLIKLVKEIIKMKEKLSASGADEIQMIVELDDEKDDFVVDFSRNELNELLKKNGFDDCLRSNIEDLLKVLPTEMQNKIEPVIVGGCSRIPLLKSVLCSIVNKDALLYKSNYGGLIQTLNLDECNSEGCCVKYIINNEYVKWECVLFDESTKRKNNFFSSSLSPDLINKYIETANNLLGTDMKNKTLSLFKNEIEASLYHYQRNVNEINNTISLYKDHISNDIKWIKDSTEKTMDVCKERYERIKTEYGYTDVIINGITSKSNSEYERLVYRTLMRCRRVSNNLNSSYLEKIRAIEDKMLENDAMSEETLNELFNEATALYEEIKESYSIKQKFIISSRREKPVMSFSVSKNSSSREEIRDEIKDIKKLFQNIDHSLLPNHMLDKLENNLDEVDEEDLIGIAYDLDYIKYNYNYKSKDAVDIAKYIQKLGPLCKYLHSKR